MEFNVLDFGARPGTNELCTNQIQAAIDKCARLGGGRVTVPAGTYISGTIRLRSHVELHLEHGSVIKGSTNMDDYNGLNEFSQNFSSPVNEKWLGKHLLLAVECEDIAITGTGMFDGSGDAFFGEKFYYSAYVWNEGCTTAKDDSVLRPGQLICIVECKNVTIRDITLANQPCWGCYLFGCDYVTVVGMKSKNPHYYFNSDGIDIDCCRFVTVSDCILDTGDDAIAIRGNEYRLKNRPHPCEYISISNCVLGSASCSVRVGVGKEGTIRHVRISNLTITRGAPMIQFMSAYKGHGDVMIQDVNFSNISATNCTRVLEMDESAGVKIENITLENIRVETQGYFNLKSNFSDTVNNVTLRNFDVIMTEAPEIKVQRDYERRGTVWFRANNINALTLENIHVYDNGSYLSAWEDGTFEFNGCSDLKIKDVMLNGEKVEL
jgi:polygalacturonase